MVQYLCFVEGALNCFNEGAISVSHLASSVRSDEFQSHADWNALAIHDTRTTSTIQTKFHPNDNKMDSPNQTVLRSHAKQLSYRFQLYTQGICVTSKNSASAVLCTQTCTATAKLY